MVCKSAETTCNGNNAFGPGTANEHTVPWSFKNFSKGDESLEHKEHSCWLLQGDNNQLKALSKLILLQLQETFWRAQCQPFHSCSVFEANWKGEKAW